MKPLIYQIFTRLYTNQNASNVPSGTLEENGCGKLNDFTAVQLKRIADFGFTHVWFTGLLEHATQTSYEAYGIRPDHPAVVKGRAGSPYAIKDYYDIDPDLATDVPNRMKEFENLVRRTHKAGLKLVIDFVPNHVARQYASDACPEGVRDLGADDDTAKAFDPDNNFYYIPVYISKQGRWYTGEALFDLKKYRDMNALTAECREVFMRPEFGDYNLYKAKTGLFGSKVEATIDVVIPVLHGTNGEDGMHNCQQHASDDHQRGALPELVINASEDRSQEYGAERQHRRNQACQILGNPVFEYHELGRELEEREDPGVEHQTEHGDVPEAPVRDKDLKVGELEALLRFCLCEFAGLVLFPVHHIVDDEADHSDAEHGGTEADRGRNPSHHLCERQGERQGGGCTDTGKSHLETHRKSQFMTGEPLDNHLADRFPAMSPSAVLPPWRFVPP